MKKIIYIIILMFLLSGCKAEYNLHIVSDDFSEDIYLIGENEEETQNVINYIWPIQAFYDSVGSSEEPKELEGIEYYKKNITDDNKLNFQYKFNNSNINRSYAIDLCFNAFDIDTTNRSLIISTENKNRCFDAYPILNEIIVNITVDREVEYHNADLVNGKQYTWVYNRNSYTNKFVSLNTKPKPTEDKKEVEEENKVLKWLKTTKGPLLIVFYVLIIAIPIGLIVYIIRKNSSKSNRL